MEETVMEEMGKKGLLLVQNVSEFCYLYVGLSHFQWVIFEYRSLLALAVEVLREGLERTPSSC